MLQTQALKKRIVSAYLSFSILLLSCLSLLQTAHAGSVALKLGDTPLHILYHSGRAPMLVHLHENETSAYAAVRQIGAKQGNAWLSLRHGGGRNVLFCLRGKKYAFDPNRIYTPQGIQKTLTRYSHYDPKAAREVNKLASAIKDLIGERPVIAVHNNQGYSLRDYLPGHPLAREARDWHLANPAAYRNFFLVTRPQDFSALEKAAQNVIAQALQAEDDGSLSVYLAQSPYINVEAGFNQVRAQREMLKKADRLLRTV